MVWLIIGFVLIMIGIAALSEGEPFGFIMLFIGAILVVANIDDESTKENKNQKEKIEDVITIDNNQIKENKYVEKVITLDNNKDTVSITYIYKIDSI